MYLRAAVETNTSVNQSLSIFFKRKPTYNIYHEIVIMPKSRFLTGSQTPKGILEE